MFTGQHVIIMLLWCIPSLHPAVSVRGWRSSQWAGAGGCSSSTRPPGQHLSVSPGTGWINPPTIICRKTKIVLKLNYDTLFSRQLIYTININTCLLSGAGKIAKGLHITCLWYAVQGSCRLTCSPESLNRFDLSTFLRDLAMNLTSDRKRVKKFGSNKTAHCRKREIKKYSPLQPRVATSVKFFASGLRGAWLNSRLTSPFDSTCISWKDKNIS